MLHLPLVLAVAAFGAASDGPSSALESTREATKEKRWNVARDFAGMVPVGPVAAEAGPMVGPLVRLGFEATPSVEIAMRSGYLYGLDRPIGDDRVMALSAIPILASVRWFAFGKSVGPYVGIEAGASLLRRRYRSIGESALLHLDFDAKESAWAVSATAGIGWVVSRKVPIDVRGEAAALDVVGGKVALGATAGWTIYF